MVKERLWKKNSNISQIFGTTEKKEEDDEKYRITSNQHVFDRYRWESTIGPGDNRCYTPLSLRSFLILRTLILSLMSVRWIPGQKQFSRGDMTTSRGICTNQSKPQSKNYTSERYWVPKKGKILKKHLGGKLHRKAATTASPLTETRAEEVCGLSSGAPRILPRSYSVWQQLKVELAIVVQPPFKSFPASLSLSLCVCDLRVNELICREHSLPRLSPLSLTFTLSTPVFPLSLALTVCELNLAYE